MSKTLGRYYLRNGVSALLTRNDNPVLATKVKQVNLILDNYCQMNKLPFLRNANINTSPLNNKGLHLFNKAVCYFKIILSNLQRTFDIQLCRLMLLNRYKTYNHLSHPRANGAKRRARVLIPHGYLHPGKGKHSEV